MELQKVYILHYDGALTEEVISEAKRYVVENLLTCEPLIQIVIDGKDGISSNLDCYSKVVGRAKNENVNLVVITNQVELLKVYDVWNGSYHNVYLYDKKKHNYVIVKDLVDKDLRKAHNLTKMYIAGSFNDAGTFN